MCPNSWIILTEEVAQRYSVKKVFLKISFLKNLHYLLSAMGLIWNYKTFFDKRLQWIASLLPHNQITHNRFEGRSASDYS